MECSVDLALNLADLAAAIADRGRARMLLALLDGRAHTATELASIAEVAASTASSHLHKLLSQGLVRSQPQGRHRYFALRDASVAEALERLLRLAGSASAKTSAPPVSTPQPLRFARSCYDHCAGALAVSLHDRMLERHWLREEAGQYRLSRAGTEGFAALDIDGVALASARRRFAYACLDWSERRPHLAGALGAALLQRLLDKQWLRRDLDSRLLRLTTRGRTQLARHFELDAGQLNEAR